MCGRYEYFHIDSKAASPVEHYLNSLSCADYYVPSGADEGKFDFGRRFFVGVRVKQGNFL